MGPARDRLCGGFFGLKINLNIKMGNNYENLTDEEKEVVDNYMSHLIQGEMAQSLDLIENCNSPSQFAKTHSAYVKDWEKTKQQSEYKLKNGILPPNTSANLYRAIIDASDEVTQRKLGVIRNAFEKKFGESIYNYLGSDGKVKKFFGLF